MADFRPLVPPNTPSAEDRFNPYHTHRESEFTRLGAEPRPHRDRAPDPPAGTRSAEAAPPTEAPRPPVQDVAAMLIEAEARGRALAHAELQSMRRDVEAVRTALEQDRLHAQKILDAIKSVEDLMKMEFRYMFGEVVLAAARRLANSEAARDAVFRNRLEAVAEQLVLEKEVILRVPSQYLELAQTIMRDRAGWVVVEDAHLETGCVADCRSGNVDGSVDAALEGLEGAVREWLSQGAEGQVR